MAASDYALTSAGGGLVLDGKELFVGHGDSLDGFSEKELEALASIGVIGPAEEAAPEGESPLLIPDVRDAGVEELGRYIDDANLNAADTVALADNDPELAEKVIEAEKIAQGGDGRKTVVEPLTKLATDPE